MPSQAEEITTGAPIDDLSTVLKVWGFVLLEYVENLILHVQQLLTVVIYGMQGFKSKDTFLIPTKCFS